jgi:adenine-specific DNA-methyltransferase
MIDFMLNIGMQKMEKDIWYFLDEIDYFLHGKPGSNYFMLNVIAENKIPLNISSVSGIPVGWNKSVYNNKAHASIAMKDLVEVSLKKSKFLLISYNNEGLIDKEGWQDIFKNYNVKIYEVESRYIKGSKHSKGSFVEQLFLVFNK